ncbi:serine/threonine-protein kinase [Vitiosangium sp. GDMCC 1.1324]|uniref:serine/threonine-protein kinase n=1 Tax=Vitiosangium sp. (strain GDMCC 1.1324) TaxID=2138576 RepID=UPI000D33ACC0|nr:serine/threonine protein kinase [Vitiosangium sp. GDMCC 1.1324]PTL77491.1 serine/threonine protein kinase [Vitiosangium sp. GDMCC 1.1324]
MGGMAELFLAQEPPRPGLLVIKRILPYLTEEPEFVQMFLDEARIAAQLHHPNVVQVFELGRINESIFIAMEYVEGVDLRRILAEEAKFSAAVPYGVASRICAQVAAGLEHAHNSKGVDGRPLGLIHRDVSPQNVMVAYNGSVKLVDFGIAKAEALAERSKPGVIKGKFLYLSPEQVMQERLDHRSDVFALGVMLYEITTGRSPYARPTTEAILYAIRFENPSPPHLIRDGYPQELSRIVMKCLVKDRNQRYQRAAQVQADLEALLASGAMRQSDDVQAYVARLLGEEEERTVLHVPIPSGRKDAASTPPPAGLAARPTRRPSAQNMPMAVDPEGAEPATEMARPRELLAAAALGDEEDQEEPTAIRTLPTGRAPTSESRPLPRTVSSESTMQDRPARMPVASPRRPTPVRKPTTSGPVAATDRRRPAPPVDDEEGAQSVSVTAATLNERAPVRSPLAYRDEDSAADSEISATHDLPRAVPSSEDPDDGESTTGYENTYTETDGAPAPVVRGGRSRGLRLLLVALVTLLVVSAAAAAWLFLFAPPPKRALRPVPETAAEGSEAPHPSRDAHPDAPPASTGTGTAPGPGAVAPESGTGAGTPAAEPGTGSAPANPGATGTAPAGQETTGTSPGSLAAGNAEAPAAGTAAGLAANAAVTGSGEPPAESPSPPAAPAEVRVVFKAPSGMSIKVGATKVKPNGSLSLAPGIIQFSVRCSNKGPWNSKDFTLPENARNQFVVKLSKLDCPQKSRR